MGVVETARALVLQRFPEVLVALLAGSSARGQATATSDLDIVVVQPGSGRSFRETIWHRGQAVELFVYTEDHLLGWWQRDARAHCNTLADMCAHGVVLLDHGRARALQERAAALLAAGPEPLTRDELDRRRYLLTAALEDLADAVDDGERAALAAVVLTQAGELALLSRQRWLGQGKWLVRRLREADPDLASELLAGHRSTVAEEDPSVLVAVADHVLDAVGGRLAEGYRVG